MSMGRYSTALVAACLLGCAGCNVDKVAQAVDGADKAMAGSRHTSGGVNYQGPGSDAGGGWDRQVSACHTNSGGFAFAGSGGELLQVDVAQSAVAGVVVHGPAGDVHFAAGDCSTRKLTEAASVNDTSRVDGRIALDCAAGGRELRASVDFAGCGR